MTETVLVNGVDLNSLVWNVTDLSGLIQTPPKRGENLVVAGRHGELRRKNKLYGPNEFVLPMWVVGANPANGVAPPDTQAQAQEFLARISELIKLFTTETVVLDHVRPDGTTRRAICEVLKEFDPSRILGGPITGKVNIPLEMADPFWSDLTTTTMTFNVANFTELELTDFAPADAPIADLTILFGPGSNPELAQNYVASYLAYDGIIAEDTTLSISTGQWAMLPGAGDPWDPSFQALRHGGLRGPWFQISPEPTGAPKLLFTHSGGGTMSVTITAKRRYLTG